MIYQSPAAVFGAGAVVVEEERRRGGGESFIPLWCRLVFPSAAAAVARLWKVCQSWVMSFETRGRRSRVAAVREILRLGLD